MFEYRRIQNTARDVRKQKIRRVEIFSLVKSRSILQGKSISTEKEGG